MAKRFDREAMLKLPHPQVRARYQAMFGEAPRSPNKTWMVNQMGERHAARKAEKRAARQTDGARPTAPEDGQPRRSSQSQAGSAPASDEAAEIEAAPEAEAAPDDTEAGAQSTTHERGRYRSMTVEELRELYVERVGRSTSSEDKQYLIWKLRQAERGKIRVGPVVHGQRLEGELAHNDRTLPLTMAAAAVAALDAAWARAGFRSRMAFMRTAIRELLEHRGETDAATHFPDKGTA